MGFLDKVKDAAGKAADQAKHATALGKEKIEDVRLQKKINDLCQEIGALVVAQRRNEAPEDAPAQIDAKIAEIAEIEKQMERNRRPAGGCRRRKRFLIRAAPSRPRTRRRACRSRGPRPWPRRAR